MPLALPVSRLFVISALCGLLFLSSPALAQTSLPTPPVAKRVDTAVELHGDRLVDPYAWLKDKTNPEVIAYLEAENRYTDGVVKPLGALEQTLYDEMLGRIKQTDLSVPYRLHAAKPYPAMLVKTSLNDSQVLFHEPAKYVARMRATRTDRNPLVFKVNMAAGHGGSSGRFDRLREEAFDYAFMLWQMGVVRLERPTADR